MAQCLSMSGSSILFMLHYSFCFCGLRRKGSDHTPQGCLYLMQRRGYGEGPNLTFCCLTHGKLPCFKSRKRHPLTSRSNRGNRISSRICLQTGDVTKICYAKPFQRCSLRTDASSAFVVLRMRPNKTWTDKRF